MHKLTATILVIASIHQAFAGRERILVQLANSAFPYRYIYFYDYIFQQDEPSNHDLAESLRHVKHLAGKNVVAQLERNAAIYFSGQVTSFEEPSPKRMFLEN